jgi:hypothetical protein
MGAGLAGGQWERIAEIIEAELCNYGLHVTVYDYELAFGPDCKT